MLFYVFYCQGFLILITENGLMLRAMILEHPAYALHLRAENDVADKNGQAHNALYERAQDLILLHKRHRAADQIVNPGGKDEKQQHRQRHAQHGSGNGNRLHGFITEFPVDPGVKPTHLLLACFLIGFFRRQHQRPIPNGKGIDKPGDSPQQGRPEQRIFVPQGLDL